MPRININRDQFNAALAAYKEQGVSATDLADLEWLWGYIFSEHRGDHERVADLMDVHPTTIWKLCIGKYEAEIDGMVDRIRRLRKRAAAQISTLVETCVTKRIFEALDYARDYRAMVLVMSETGRGKTVSAQEWVRRNNHGMAHYIRLVGSCSRAKLVRAVARACGVGIGTSPTADVEEAVFRAINKDKVLIFDEAGHAVPVGERVDRNAIEFLRDLFDVCGCGIALLITDVYWQQIQKGKQAAFFEQFRGRCQYRLCIPKGKIFADEVRALVTAYAGGKPDRDLLAAAGVIAHQDGKLRTLCDDLAKARRFAAQTGKPLTAEILVASRQWRDDGGVWTEETI